MKIMIVVASLLAIALSLGGQDVSRNAPPSTPAKGDSSVNKPSGNRKADEDKKAGSAESLMSPCTQESPCFVVTKPQAKSAEEQVEDDSLDRLYRRYMWATIIGVVAASIGLALIFWQTRIASRSARAANIAAEASKRQSDAMITGERAWMLADIGEIDDTFESNLNSIGVLDVRPIVRNHGRTPGTIKRGFIRYHLVAGGIKLPPEPDYAGALATQEVYVIVPPNAALQPLHVPIPISEFAAIRHGDPTLYIYGFIDYVDFAEQVRQTRFCFEYHVPHGFDPQSRGFYISVNVPVSYIKCT
jgi:hypothetical protein